MKKKIKKLSNELNIKFLGKIDFFESTDLIGNSKILINTSDNNSDGLPNTFIQSWLAGTIVCSINHNPNNWMDRYDIGYCSDGNILDLCDKVKYFSSNSLLLDEMSLKSKKFAKEKFSNDKIIQKYINLFKEQN